MSTNDNNYITKVSVSGNTYDVDGCGGLTIDTNHNEIFNDLKQNTVDARFKFNHIEGTSNRSISDWAMISGYFNEPVTDGLWMLGCGSSDSQRKNALMVDIHGNVYIKNKVKLIDKLEEFLNVMRRNSFPTGMVLEVKTGSLMEVALKQDPTWEFKSDSGSGYKKYLKK